MKSYQLTGFVHLGMEEIWDKQLLGVGVKPSGKNTRNWTKSRSCYALIASTNDVSGKEAVHFSFNFLVDVKCQHIVDKKMCHHIVDWYSFSL
jgi:hypothetical protein